MKKIIIALVILVGSFTVWFYVMHPLVTTVTVGNTVFTVDVAVTARDKELGLGYRDSLRPDHGMLFVYTNKERYPFWMRNMRFPIDIIWIDGRTVVDITTNVPPSNKLVNLLPIYHPKVPVDHVLELTAWTAERIGIRIGDTITIKS